MQSVEPLRLSFFGVMRDDLTGERIDVSWEYTIADDGQATIVVDVHGEQFTRSYVYVHGAMTRFLHATCFGDLPPGEAAPRPAPPPPVVNIDGTPRNKLHDRMRRRRSAPEAFAAD